MKTLIIIIVAAAFGYAANWLSKRLFKSENIITKDGQPFDPVAGAIRPDKPSDKNGI